MDFRLQIDILCPNPLALCYRISILTYSDKQKCIYILRSPNLPQDDDTIKIIPIFYYNDYFYGINKLSRLLSKRGTCYSSYCPIYLKGLLERRLQALLLSSLY